MNLLEIKMFRQNERSFVYKEKWREQDIQFYSITLKAAKQVWDKNVIHSNFYRSLN